MGYKRSRSHFGSRSPRRVQQSRISRTPATAQLCRSAMALKKPGTKQPVRLYTKGIIMGYKRSKSNSYPQNALVKIEGVLARADTAFYLWKRIAYVYKCKREVKNSRFRVIWGKVRRPHGNNGVVRAKFKRNIPPKAFGAPCRVMLYPSNV